MKISVSGAAAGRAENSRNDPGYGAPSYSMYTAVPTKEGYTKSWRPSGLKVKYGNLSLAPICNTYTTWNCSHGPATSNAHTAEIVAL